jgi:hypothetical protein
METISVSTKIAEMSTITVMEVIPMVPAEVMVMMVEARCLEKDPEPAVPVIPGVVIVPPVGIIVNVWAAII